MHRLLEKITTRLGYFLFRSLYASYRFIHVNEQQRDVAMSGHEKGSYLAAAWHEHVIMLIMAQKGHPFHPVVSKSSSGRFVGYVCQKFGFTPIHGSADRDGKDKGGLAALFALLRTLKKGFPVAITVDGSIGPRRFVKPGIIELSRKTGARILPIGCAASNFWTLNTWDKTQIPKPFSKIYVYYGEPFEVSKDVKSEDFAIQQELIASAINSAEKKADAARIGLGRANYD